MLDLEPADIAALTLQQSELLSTVRDGVMAVDAADNIILANAPAAAALGLSQVPAGLGEVWPELRQLSPDKKLATGPFRSQAGSYWST